MLELMTGGRNLRLAVLASCALAMPGCNGEIPTGPTRKVITEQGWTLAVGQALSVDVEITGVGSGTVDATAEWTLATDDVDIYVTAPACTIDMLAGQMCAYKAKADSTTAKPEKVSFSASAGDKYRFWIVNFGPQPESGTFSAGLTQ
jgi:hypothetical protein